MKLRSICIVVFLLVVTSISAAAQVKLSAADQQARQRADALLAKMTLDEKIGQMNQLFFFPFQPEAAFADGIRKGQTGSLLFVTDPAVTNRLQKVAVTESRLNIPLIFGFDVIHGFHTIFPVPLAMAASWDPAMVERSQTVAASEARSVGINWTFAPMVDIARDPRWGRIVEGAGEDPYLGSAMARRRFADFRATGSAAPATCWRASSTLPDTVRLRAAATTTRRTSPMPRCGTSISRRSRPRSTPASAA